MELLQGISYVTDQLDVPQLRSVGRRMLRDVCTGNSVIFCRH